MLKRTCDWCEEDISTLPYRAVDRSEFYEFRIDLIDPMKDGVKHGVSSDVCPGCHQMFTMWLGQHKGKQERMVGDPDVVHTAEYDPISEPAE